MRSNFNSPRGRLVRLARAGLLCLAAAAMSGCQKLEAGEYGVLFSALPPWIGGGVQNAVAQPGEMKIVLPWEKLYRVDTTVHSVGWGGVGQGSNRTREDYVETRALDGNEVGLAITIQYRIDKDKILHLIQKVGTDQEAVERLVSAVARADIRTHMNTLRTRDFFSPEKRQVAIEAVKEALQRRLGPEGISIRDVIYNDHRFERRIAGGAPDPKYQELIDRTQATNEETKQEEKKIATVTEEKRQEFNETQARVNRVLEAADGFKQQATLRGDGFLNSRKNEAAQVTAVGMAEVEGLKKQVEAMSGPGGRAILRLAIVKELLTNNSKFVVLNSTGRDGNALDLNKLDANDLVKQAGIFAAVPEIVKEKPESPESKRGAADSTQK